MKHAYEAAAYDTWLNEKVGASLAGLADGSKAIIPTKEWKLLRDQKRSAMDNSIRLSHV